MASEGKNDSQINASGEWEQMEQGLRLRDHAIEAASSGVVISDPNQPDNPIIYCNPAFEKITGYARAEVLGRNCRFLQHPPGGPPCEENAAALEKMRAALRSQSACQVLLRNFRKDGTPFWNELTLTPVFDPAGRLTNYVGVQADATIRQEIERDHHVARKELRRLVSERTAQLSKLNESLYEQIVERSRVERALRRAEKKYRGIVENAVEGIYQSTVEGRYLSVNPALARMYGYASPEDLTTGVIDIQKDVYVIPAQRLEFQRLIAVQGTVNNFEYQIRRRDGRPLWISENARAVKDRKGEVLYYEGTIQDISARKLAEIEKERLEAQLRQSQKMEAIGTLAGGIAHDFNNILTAIIGYTELSLDDLPPDSVPHQNLGEVIRAGSRARDLVRRILAFSRKNVQELRPIALRPVVEEVIQLLRASIPSTIRINATLTAEADTVVADPGQVHQVLMNLCTNASHAMRDQGGTLEVRLESAQLDAPAQGLANHLQPGRYVRLSVQDDGHGIEPAILERIFEPFFTTKPVGEGTGLGLSVVHGIVRHHGGDISVTSQVGLGTTIQILLPLAPPLKSGDTTHTALQRGKGERVLVVDDEEVLANMLRQKLERLGYRVTALTDSTAALRLCTADASGFELLISDQTMPRLTGLQLAAQLRRERPDLPIILCTGFSQQIAIEALRSAGVNSCVPKPIDFAKLSVIMRTLLELPAPRSAFF